MLTQRKFFHLCPCGAGNFNRNAVDISTHWNDVKSFFQLCPCGELPISGQPAPLHSLNGNVVKGYDGRGGLPIWKYIWNIFGLENVHYCGNGNVVMWWNDMTTRGETSNLKIFLRVNIFRFNNFHNWGIASATLTQLLQCDERIYSLNILKLQEKLFPRS